MGHLINPVAFRLGWSKNWLDNYYVTNSYYPQFLHTILRLRLFLNYFFKQPSLVKLGFFFSHFNIVNTLGVLGVHIFYYDGRLEAAWNNYLYASFPLGLRHSLAVYDRFVFYKFYFLFLLLLLVNSLVTSKLNLKYITKNFFKISKTKSSLRVKRSFSQNLLKLFGSFLRNYFLGFLLGNRTFGKRRGKRSSWDYVSFAQNIFFASLSYLLVKPFFYHLTSFMTFLMKALAPQFMSTVHFYLISNNHINASFLSTYIGRRLKQGYRLSELINPLRRELTRLKKSQTSRFRKLVEKSQLSGKTLRFNYTSIFSHVLFRLFACFKRTLLNFIKVSHSLINYEFLFLVFHLIKFNLKIKFQKKLYSLREKTFVSLPRSRNKGIRNLHLQRLSGICRTLINRQAQSLFFYKNSQASFYGKYIFLNLFYPKTIHFMNKPDYYFFLREVIDNLFSNYAVFSINRHYSLASSNISLWPIYKAVSIGLGGFLRYIRFSLLKFNLAHYFRLSKLNKKTARERPITRQYGLLGFKFHLKGRFTRKQIAASHIFRRGPMPLSTLSINLDYSFSTVAIKNSAVGIKVWLYKADNFHNFYFKTI
jgi:hypothetical protein